MKQHWWYVYILSNKKDWILYIWVTSELIRRIYEHKNWIVEWFTKKYFVENLVYYEQYLDIITAIEREKQLKKWTRIKKIKLFESNNPDWRDLYEDLI
ncbi:MAG: hypothetical protein ACD_49C00073G0004 [uncultured bacterium (gcode 4)]|uniref:GIY-YIG domain-containing protein n=1 Tax=uncultured bacterium (gcode 4) TaxID=1234023 RepID=K2AW78_9BACT|nr:MAG: hypothetical protein ACD_49C00073G0004 [uncultured bacterium (gcode 4)]